MTHKRDRTLFTSGLARVEGEGAMYVRVSGGLVDEVQLNIYEPPRFFEAFLPALARHGRRAHTVLGSTRPSAWRWRLAACRPR